VADSRQFGSKAPQFGDKISPGGKQPGDSANCAQCEAMLADALDGTLSSTDQAIFDIHMGHCGPCSQMLADARRGAAWLEMLRDPRPEPPAALLERILAQTSGSVAHQAGHIAIDEAQLPGTILTPAPIYGGAAPYIPASPAQFGRIIPFRSRFASAVRHSAVGQIMLQPRLAMTAAMAFLSIALTMDLTGVRLQDLRISDLRPSSLQRDFYSANARVVQYYEGLRVVYELESRVHDFESATDSDAPAGTQTAPSQESSPSAAPNGAAPDSPQNDDQLTQPDQTQPSQPSNPQPQRRQRPPAARPTPDSGTSRREDLNSNRHVATLESFGPNPAKAERTLA
jgi:Putative zinc-finger